MKHLTDDQCLEVMEGRASRDAADHASQCADCAAKINAWRQSVEQLENFSWPVRMPQRVTPFAPMLKWAMAASVALLIGFGAGRSSRTDVAALKAEIQGEVVARMHREQAERDRALIGAMKELRDQQMANYLILRNDLETLASTAEARLQRLASVTTEIP